MLRVNRVIDIIASLTPSARGELEISDIKQACLKAGGLTVVRMGRRFAWFDTGTHNSLQYASPFVRDD